jgi:hypothetical protein
MATPKVLEAIIVGFLDMWLRLTCLENGISGDLLVPDHSGWQLTENEASRAMFRKEVLEAGSRTY